MPTEFYTPSTSSGQFDLAAGVLTDIYATPADKTVDVSVVFCNRTGVASVFRLALSRGGVGIENSHYMFYDGPLGPNETIVVSGISISQLDVLRAYAAAANVSVNVLIGNVRILAVGGA